MNTRLFFPAQIKALAPVTVGKCVLTQFSLKLQLPHCFIIERRLHVG